jgi:hypothetical protein
MCMFLGGKDSRKQEMGFNHAVASGVKSSEDSSLAGKGRREKNNFSRCVGNSVTALDPLFIINGA